MDSRYMEDNKTNPKPAVPFAISVQNLLPNFSANLSTVKSITICERNKVKINIEICFVVTPNSVEN